MKSPVIGSMLPVRFMVTRNGQSDDEMLRAVPVWTMSIAQSTGRRKMGKTRTNHAPVMSTCAVAGADAASDIRRQSQEIADQTEPEPE